MKTEKMRAHNQKSPDVAAGLQSREEPFPVVFQFQDSVLTNDGEHEDDLGEEHCAQYKNGRGQVDKVDHNWQCSAIIKGR